MEKNYLPKQLLILFICMLSMLANAQSRLQLQVADAMSKQPLAGVTVTLITGNSTVQTDAAGHCILPATVHNNTQVRISSIGYETVTLPIAQLTSQGYSVYLTPASIELKTVLISAHPGEQYKAVSKMDIAMRGVNNSQEVLRIIPGIVIGQHQGGGKAEQIFLRGFDADHGTDFRMEADGVPINMVSHAHGQGFADSHFIIPETIDQADFQKGPYAAAKGDFASTGFADFATKNVLPANLVKLEAGQFNTFRGLLMMNLLPSTAKEKQQYWYTAAEFRYADGYFDAPQHFSRTNLFTKYTAQITRQSRLTASGGLFSSKWNASGQIPQRAVDQGLIGFYGAIDPFEGGLTQRANVNAQLLTTFSNGDVLKNQLYYVASNFDLHTNFTFFLEDSINGDRIRQQETRQLMGYNGSYRHTGYLNTLQLISEAGLQVRYDKVKDASLSHSLNRFTLLRNIKLGDIDELSVAPYISETLQLNEHFTINAGLRYDQFFHRYYNKLSTDTTLRGIGAYTASAGIVSPKLNVSYHASNNLQWYLSMGKGFHSNDTRAVVVQHGYQVLPAAYSADLGVVAKPASNIIVNAALWYIYLQQEFVYSGDGGFVEFSGKTRRVGVDFSSRYEPIHSLYIDLDINYAHGRIIGEAKGNNYIPLAPVWTSSGGITYAARKGLNGSIRYRFVGSRAANEDYSLQASGYFITDAVLNYTKPRYEIGLVVNNVLNTRWKETQFATETRIKGETQPVDEVCFTPGTPFAAKLSFTIKF
ncbi:MAG TPA: TonB-dependent receptor [Chitinophagaceae bacterium]|nr:TonB-dependent receptor [Chitinophagaceae bacterium]